METPPASEKNAEYSKVEDPASVEAIGEEVAKLEVSVPAEAAMEDVKAKEVAPVKEIPVGKGIHSFICVYGVYVVCMVCMWRICGVCSCICVVIGICK